MNKNIDQIFTEYISGISSKYKHEANSEMGYRTEFEILLKEVFQEIGVRRIDHDAKSFKGNKPDYVVFKEVPILYLEVKDIGVSLDKIEKSEQMSRYFGYDNLVLTDYVEFRFYRNGERYEEPIKIAEYDSKNRIITPLPSNYDHLATSIVDFTKSHKEPIKSGLQLARIMGGKGRRIRDNVLDIFESGKREVGSLEKVFDVFKSQLIHDLSVHQFADMYAQTLVYGLFVARFHDETPENFSRQEARDLVPASNPLLRHFFDHIVGPDFNKSLEYIVNELCEVYSHSDVEKLMSNYYKINKEEIKEEDKYKEQDPVIHFYEDFLKEYDPELRKKMGAYYTPLPVVRFIIRAVDDILQKEFGLAGGIASTEKLPDGQHKVQILDPATGTGTFLTELISEIYKKFDNQKGAWPAYVHHELLPRIFGFELMMAPYTIAHLKMSMQLKSMGFKYFNNTRLGIYLTNALENDKEELTLFSGGFGLSESISEESKEAHKIKNEKPIMVVIGNPPYSVSSSNKGAWIQEQIKEYKKDLNEKKINLDDDYIKFIRFSQVLIDQNGEGIVAMITNNSFIDGVTHRQMRKSLLESFDSIYILDLHGNAKKKETAPDGGKDENVFDIMQGVSINIFVKKKGKKQDELGKVFHVDAYGDRYKKFDAMNVKKGISDLRWDKLDYKDPNYFFVPIDYGVRDEYLTAVAITELLKEYNSGVQTKNDSLSVQFDKSTIHEVIDDFKNIDADTLKSKYSLKDTSGWKVNWAMEDIRNNNGEFHKITYRPLDDRYTYMTDASSGFIGRPRMSLNQHFINGRYNLGLITVRQQSTFDFQHILVTQNIAESGAISLQTKEWGYIFPLYTYNEETERATNLDIRTIKNISEKLALEFIPDHEHPDAGKAGTFNPLDILDYIYAILHSPTYRERYKEFLKIDFPRIPFTSDKELFWKMVEKGRELREYHLMEHENSNRLITSFPEAGDNAVTKVQFEEGKVWINDTQYIEGVPELAWNFYIGGYQPAQKWLKDRKKAERKLSFEDITHYQKIIVALVNTDRIMKEIDKIIPEWPLK